jgi:hypothetical protein
VYSTIPCGEGHAVSKALPTALAAQKLFAIVVLPSCKENMQEEVVPVAPGINICAAPAATRAYLPLGIFVTVIDAEPATADEPIILLAVQVAS